MKRFMLLKDVREEEGEKFLVFHDCIVFGKTFSDAVIVKNQMELEVINIKELEEDEEFNMIDYCTN